MPHRIECVLEYGNHVGEGPIWTRRTWLLSPRPGPSGDNVYNSVERKEMDRLALQIPPL
jgi:hypothetical protein